MKKNEPIKKAFNQNGHEQYFHCQKCKSEFVILLFDELPEEAQVKFKLILRKMPIDTKAFYFYCRCCDEFSVLHASKK